LVENLVTESVQESVILRVMPADTRGVLLHRLAPGFHALCHAQHGFELGLICAEGRELWFVQDRLKRLIIGTTVRTVLQKRRTSQIASYPKIKVGLGEEMSNHGAPYSSGDRLMTAAGASVDPGSSDPSAGPSTLDAALKSRADVKVVVKKRRHFTLPIDRSPHLSTPSDAS
jgi:hypothetical protein